jgi:Asp-tRNA(Asn)/Glu-tRNA(Gln) amidotransferase A subunit family amidase
MIKGEIVNLTASGIVEAISKNEVSVEQVCREHLAVIKARDSHVRAWEYVREDLILENASRLDKEKKKRKLGALAGVPIGIKDVFNTKDFPTEMGSPLWKGFTPGNNARVVHDIIESDAIVFGKTVTAEFAVHYLSADKTVNPHNPKHIPGTSSSGSAAAVATKMVPVSLGTQTAGSIIRPASYCGVYGFKPTFGTIPRTGTLKTTDTLDTIGCFSNSVDDLKLVFDVARVKGKDYPFVNKNLDHVTPSLSMPIKVGYIIDGIKVFDKFPEYAIKALGDFISLLKQDKRFLVEKINAIPELNQVHDAHATIYDKTLSYYFNIEFENKDKGLLSDIIIEALEKGKTISASAYIEAIGLQSKIRAIVEKVYSSYDIILALSTAGEAPLLHHHETADTCLIWTFLGMPTVNLPIFKGPLNLPFGLQAVGGRYTDYKLLQICNVLIGFHNGK